MPIEHYLVGDVIGKGTYGEVRIATHKKDKKKYVIKKIELYNANSKERAFAKQEVDILSKLRHPNIVTYKESYQSEDGCLFIVMGYCEGGDLYTRLKKQAKQKEYLEETQIVEWFVQITMALQYMHDRNILHRDLKTQNIFLTKSKIIKLGDLGIARVLENNSDMATTIIGTPYYMSPELFSNKPYNYKSDMWALGCCVYEMATLKHAFNAKDMSSLVYNILKGKMPSMPRHYTEELSNIIKWMLNHDPSKRPSASRVLRHAFIKRHIALFLEGTKTRQKRKSHEEKPRKSPTKDSNDVNSEALATASKINIEILPEQNKAKQIDSKSCSKTGQDCNDRDHENSTEGQVNPEQKITKPSNMSFPDEEKKLKKKQTSEEIKRSKVSKKNSSSDKVEKLKKRASREENSSKKAFVDSPESEKVPEQKRNPGQSSENAEIQISTESNPPKNTDSSVRKIFSEQKSNSSESPDKEWKLKRRISANKEMSRGIQQGERVSSASSQEDKTEKRKQVRKKERKPRPLPVCPSKSTEETKYAVLPPPRFSQKKQPEKNELSSDVPKSNGDQFRKENGEKPKLSSGVPNIAARKKRRERQQESLPQFSPPSLSKKDSNTALSCPSFPRKSNKDIIKEHLRRTSLNNQERDVVDGPSLSHQGSVEDSSSEQEENMSHDKASDVMNFIDTLQATLKLEDKSEEIEEDAFNPSPTGRLNDRIVRLKNECVAGVGVEMLEKAYKIFDLESEEEAEIALVNLMGREKFKLYSGLIWQLKFCEDHK